MYDFGIFQTGPDFSIILCLKLVFYFHVCECERVPESSHDLNCVIRGCTGVLTGTYGCTPCVNIYEVALKSSFILEKKITK